MNHPAASPGAAAPMTSLLGFNLRLAQLLFFEAFYRDFGDSGVTPAEYSILALLAHDRGLRQGEIAARLHIKRSNMTKVMRALEKRGLVRRSKRDDDGRALEVGLTRTGAKLQKNMANAMRDHDRAVAAALTMDEQQKLLALLRKLLGEANGPGRVSHREIEDRELCE